MTSKKGKCNKCGKDCECGKADMGDLLSPSVSSYKGLETKLGRNKDMISGLSLDFGASYKQKPVGDVCRRALEEILKTRSVLRIHEIAQKALKEAK